MVLNTWKWVIPMSSQFSMEVEVKMVVRMAKIAQNQRKQRFNIRIPSYSFVIGCFIFLLSSIIIM